MFVLTHTTKIIQNILKHKQLYISRLRLQVLLEVEPLQRLLPGHHAARVRAVLPDIPAAGQQAVH